MAVVDLGKNKTGSSAVLNRDSSRVRHIIDQHKQACFGLGKCMTHLESLHVRPCMIECIFLISLLTSEVQNDSS